MRDSVPAFTAIDGQTSFLHPADFADQPDPGRAPEERIEPGSTIFGRRASWDQPTADAVMLGLIPRCDFDEEQAYTFLLAIGCPLGLADEAWKNATAVVLL